MRVKYVHQRVRKDGSVYWAVMPSTKIKQTTGLGYKAFDIFEDARAYSDEICQKYDMDRRKLSYSPYIMPGTVDDLMAQYRGSLAFDKLKPNSKRAYLDKMEISSLTFLSQSPVPFGQLLARNVTPKGAEKLYLTLRKEKSENTAFHCIKVMRRVFQVSLRTGAVSSNPFINMGIKGLKDRTVLWEPEQVDQFISACDLRDMPNLGTLAMMCYHLCQRPGDIRHLKWGNWNRATGVLDFTQEKTGVRVELPLTTPLKVRLNHGGEDDSPLVPDDVTGKHHTRWSYYKQARKVMNDIGLPAELQIRDLRRTGATELAESGATEDELRSVTGHQSREVLKVYVRPTRKIASSAMSKRFG